MSISSTASSTSFSLYPEIDFEEGQVVPPNAGDEEEQAASSSQSIPLKKRISAIADRMGYCFYSSWINPPRVMPQETTDAQYKVDKKKFFADKQKPFEEINQEILDYSEGYADRRYRPQNEQENEEEWLVLSLCKQELHDLYRKEPKHLDSKHIDLWMIHDHNKTVLAQHRKEWDKLTPSEKAEKIFGKRDKYEIAIAVATAASCFFLCHTMYQFWSSHR